MTTTTAVIFLTSGTGFTPPSDFISCISIECIGGGGGGAGGNFNNGVGTGGAGGAYALLSNPTLATGTSYFFNIGAAGSAGAGSSSPGSGGAGGDTWFNTAGVNSAPTSTANGVLAKGGGGGNAVSSTAAGGGSSASCIGNTVFSGGNSGANNNAAGFMGSGGGGAAGPNGAGQNGGAVNNNSGGAPGGGGSDGGTAGDNSSAGTGGGGGTDFANRGNGATQSTPGDGNPGSNFAGNGGGGGGGALGTQASPPASANGGAGGSGINWTETLTGHFAGPGGGGGGAACVSAGGNASGGAGGNYGAGGGGGGAPSSGLDAAVKPGGVGTQGIIVITYVSQPPNAGPLVQTTLTNKAADGKWFSRKDYEKAIDDFRSFDAARRQEIQDLIDEIDRERALSDIERGDRDFDLAQEELNQAEEALFSNLTSTKHDKFSEAKERLEKVRKARNHNYYMEIINKAWADYNKSKKK